MSKKNSVVDLTGRLLVDKFAANNQSQAVVDPAEPTAMVLNIDQIDYAQHNPRSSDNPEYENIKASIAVVGLITTLTVTRHPGEDSYRLDAGGNTRLKALKALYKETGDERFGRVLVIFKPYSTDTAILVNHLVENSLRQDNTFFEKAKAIRQAMELISQNRNIQKALSNREWIALITNEYGYGIRRETFVLYQYAIDHLAECIPIALSLGLGRPSIKEISALHKKYRQYCQDEDIDVDVDILLQEVLGKLDKADLDVTEVDSQLSAAISGFHTLIGTDIKDDAKDTTPVGRRSETASDYQTASRDADLSTLSQPAQNVGQQKETSPVSVQLAMLRAEVYRSVKIFAKPFGLDMLVRKIPAGYGFYIEYPGEHIDDLSAKVCWWFLFHTSRIVEHISIFSELPAHSVLASMARHAQSNRLESQTPREALDGFIETLNEMVPIQTRQLNVYIPKLFTHPRTKPKKLAYLFESIQKIDRTVNQGKEEKAHGTA